MITRNPGRITLDYGRAGIELDLDSEIADWVVIEPDSISRPLETDELFDISVQTPIHSAPLTRIISPEDKVLIVTSDGTRPVPNRLLIPAIIKRCGLNPANVTVLIGTGSHRPHTQREVKEIVGEKIAGSCKVICHDAKDKQNLITLGTTRTGIPVSLNRHYARAEKKLVIGFIEPHFFAGFSGGPKGICPALAGLDTIDTFHSFDIIGHPNSDYGILDGNPQYGAAVDVASFAPPDFLINVILNSQKQVTAIYSGDYIAAHREGCRAAAELSMIRLNRKFPIVITTNSGYPLDQNLYQTVKGIWTAARIVEQGGAIIVASECSKGIPDDGNFANLMSARSNADDLLDFFSHDAHHIMDRWQAQKLAMALKKAEIFVYTSLGENKVSECKMRKIEDISSAISELVTKIGRKPEIAVLPRGPVTIPI